MDCATCLELHGVGCEGTHEDNAGKWVCLFCLDGVICPVQAKRLKADKKKNSGAPPAARDDSSQDPATEPEDEGKNMLNNGTDTPKKISAPGTGERRICARPGCGEALRSSNSCGKCRKHVRWSGDEHAIGVTAKANGVKKTGNGAGTGTNGHAIEVDHEVVTPKNGAAADLPELAADRVDQLLASLTAGDKARLAFAWLTGKC